MSRTQRTLFYLLLAFVAYGIALSGLHGLAFSVFLIGGIVAEAAFWREIFFGGRRRQGEVDQSS